MFPGDLFNAPLIFYLPWQNCLVASEQSGCKHLPWGPRHQAGRPQLPQQGQPLQPLFVKHVHTTTLSVPRSPLRGCLAEGAAGLICKVTWWGLARHTVMLKGWVEAAQWP